MRERRALAVLIAGLMTVSCSSGGSEPSVEPTVEPQRWQYVQLVDIESTFIDSATTGVERPAGYDAAGVELWDRFLDARQAQGVDETTVDALVEATKALFEYAYGSGIAAAMIADDIERSPATVVESSVVPFADGRPVAVAELDRVVQEEGCAAIRTEFNVWRGQTTIDEIAGRASTFARYALDQAASAGCDWAFVELTQQVLRISGLHAKAAAATEPTTT